MRSDVSVGRVALIVTLALSILAAPLLADAQQPTKIPRIGFLWPGSPGTTSHLMEEFQQGLRDLGYVEGRNIAIERRYSEGRNERLPDLASELVRLKVDIIVTFGTPAVQAARNVSGMIPIVFAVADDPVRSGLVASLARPGGNITGLSTLALELSGKRLELLKETVPRLSRVAVLWNSANPAMGQRMKETQAAAQMLRVSFQSLEVRGDPNDFERVFSAIPKERPDALLVIMDPFNLFHRGRIAELAIQNRLPAIASGREFVEDGGLMSYGPNIRENYRRAAAYVDKILKGARAGDLPVEQPTRIELFVNLKTAKALGLTIPPSVLIRADHVIQ